MDGKNVDILLPLLPCMLLPHCLNELLCKQVCLQIITQYKESEKPIDQVFFSLEMLYTFNSAILLLQTSSVFLENADPPYATLQCMRERCCMILIFILMTFQLLEHFPLINFQSFAIYLKQTEDSLHPPPLFRVP